MRAEPARVLAWLLGACVVFMLVGLAVAPAGAAGLALLLAAPWAVVVIILVEQVRARRWRQAAVCVALLLVAAAAVGLQGLFP